VRLLRRRSEQATASVAETPATLESADPRHQGGKGRPTPRRRDAQRRRTGPVAPPPKTRREAYRRMKEQGADRRVAQREGLKAGDERFLLPRDQGPERRLVRDVVDARRNGGSLFLFVAVLYFLSVFIRDVRFQAIAVSLWIAMLVLLLVDSTVLGLRIRRLIHERFPDSRERMSRLIFYGVTRATMLRRWRSPKPQVTLGDPV
jgi:hypothetical protein